MSWIPAFKVGLCNAWILTQFMILHPFIMLIVDKAVGGGNIFAKMGDDSVEAGKRKSSPIPTILLIILFVYSIFIPLKVGTAWLYTGVAVYLAGVVSFLAAILCAARTPMGQVFSRGMYRYSRHPLYLSFLLIFVGVSVASASWLFLLLSMAWMIMPISQVETEERECLASFGNEYQQYMHRTPKWLGIPKLNQD